MDRKQKIEYLKRLAAGHLAPADLLNLLPKGPGVEVWLQGRDGMFREINDGTLSERDPEALPTAPDVATRVIIECPELDGA